MKTYKVVNEAGTIAAYGFSSIAAAEAFAAKGNFGNYTVQEDVR